VPLTPSLEPVSIGRSVLTPSFFDVSLDCFPSRERFPTLDVFRVTGFAVESDGFLQGEEVVV
jgi:hypothetical protein